MVNWINSRAAVLGLMLMATPSARCEPPTGPLPDTPAGRQTRQFLEALASGKRDQLKGYIERSFSARLLGEFPLNEHVDMMSRFAAETGGLVPEEVVSGKETQVRFLARPNRGKGRFQVIVDVEAEQPYKLDRIGVSRPSPASGVQPPPPPKDPHDDSQVAAWTEDYLERLSKAGGFSGAVLVARGDRVIVAQARGLASLAWNQPNRVDTKFNLGSMNKMFTSIAIAQLVEQGKVSLDDPIGKHLADYPNKDAAAKVTVRHLLTHTSGLADYFNDSFMKASRDRFRTIADYFPLFVNEPLQFEPGAKFRYSNAGFMVLGAIVQKASGVDYFDYVREHIYKPSEMVNTDAYELDTDVPNLAVGYVRNEDAKPGDPAFRNNIFLHVIKGGPAGGGYSTVEDLHRFAQALRNGKLVRPETLRQWTTPSEKSPQYAQGFQVFHADRPRIVGHTGGFPGISSVLWIDLDSGTTVSVLANMDGGTRTIEESLRKMLTGRGD